jgi:hypothetical protein
MFPRKILILWVLLSWLSVYGLVERKTAPASVAMSPTDIQLIMAYIAMCLVTVLVIFPLLTRSNNVSKYDIGILSLTFAPLFYFGLLYVVSLI